VFALETVVLNIENGNRCSYLIASAGIRRACLRKKRKVLLVLKVRCSAK